MYWLSVWSPPVPRTLRISKSSEDTLPLAGFLWFTEKSLWGTLNWFFFYNKRTSNYYIQRNVYKCITYNLHQIPLLGTAHVSYTLLLKISDHWREGGSPFRFSANFWLTYRDVFFDRRVRVVLGRSSSSSSKPRLLCGWRLLAVPIHKTPKPCASAI